MSTTPSSRLAAVPPRTGASSALPRTPETTFARLRQLGLKPVGKAVLAQADASDITGRAAQLAYYFFFSLFPGLIAASALLGVLAKSASHLGPDMLNYLARVIPPTAFQLVADTFKQTAHASSGTKLLLGTLVALWSASAGTAALQDALNAVYSVQERRPYWRSRLEAIVLTLVVGVLLLIALGVLFGGDKLLIHFHAGLALSVGVRIISWPIAFVLLAVSFALLYWKAPDKRDVPWEWVTPGAVLAILVWLLASGALRLYLHYFDSYSVTYGSLGAVIVLLTWFYISGLAVLLGAVINDALEDLAGEGGEQKQAGAKNEGMGHEQTAAQRTSA